MVHKLTVQTGGAQESDWQLIKIHMVNHFVPSIRRGGVCREYSACMWEMLHKTTIKGFFRHSNRRQVASRILKMHALSEAMR